MASSRVPGRRFEPVNLPALSVKQSFAYGSPGLPTMPMPITKQAHKPAAVMLAEGVERAKERKTSKRVDVFVPVPTPRRKPKAPKKTAEQPPRPLAPVLELAGHEAAPMVEPQVVVEPQPGVERQSMLSFLHEGGVFHSAWVLGADFVAAVYEPVRDLSKLLLVLGLVLAPLWIGWLWGPFLLSKTSWPGVSERFSWPSVDSLQEVRQHVVHDVSSMVHRISTLEKSVKDLQFVRAQAAPLTTAPRYQVNYFSTGLGAVIDPHLTSPTMKKPFTFFQRSAICVLGLELRKPLPPVAALEPWEDIGGCWCAPPGKGKSQLAVLLPRAIHPTAITIEHIPKGATLDIAAAPREMELWAQIPDEEAREAVGDAAFGLLGSENEKQRLENSLDRTFVRIGKWEYDVHKPNHIQTFAMTVDTEHFNAKVTKVVVRTVSNWGAEHYTCLYRLRMHGTLAAGEKMSIPTPLDE